MNRGPEYEKKTCYTIGVIIPVYNCEQYLKTAVESVLEQPCKDILVIIINDGSKDKSYSIATDMAMRSDRVIVLSQENRGVSAARNRGIKAALSLSIRWLAFLDSDDAWVSGFYDEELKSFLLAENADVFSFSYYTTNQDMTRGRYFTPHLPDSKTGGINRYGGHPCSYLYKAERIKEFNIFFPEGIFYQEDKAFEYIFLSLCSTSRILDRPIFQYRSNSHSAVHNPIDVENWYCAHIIPAWQYVYTELEKAAKTANTILESDFSACLTMQKTFLAEFIETACKNGMGPKKIQKTIDKIGLSYLFDRQDIWVDSKRKKIWESFKTHPTMVYLRFRAIGIGISFLLHFRNLPFVERKRYPIRLESSTR